MKNLDHILLLQVAEKKALAEQAEREKQPRSMLLGGLGAKISTQHASTAAEREPERIAERLQDQVGARQIEDGWPEP